MSILAGTRIVDAVEDRHIRITPFDPAMVTSNGIDLHLGVDLWTYNLPRNNALDARIQYKLVKMAKTARGGWELRPGRTYHGLTHERLEVDDLVPRLGARANLSRLGVIVHSDGGDAGFCGRWDVTLSVARPVTLYPGMRLFNVTFTQITGTYHRPYRGDSRNLSAPRPAWVPALHGAPRCAPGECVIPSTEVPDAD